MNLYTMLTLYPHLLCFNLISLKHFAHPDFDTFRRFGLEPRFKQVAYIKPSGSRAESSEGFFVCLGYNGLDHVGKV